MYLMKQSTLEWNGSIYRDTDMPRLKAYTQDRYLGKAKDLHCNSNGEYNYWVSPDDDVYTVKETNDLLFVVKENGVYKLETDRAESIGKIKAFYGNAAVCLRGRCYLKQFDGKTLKTIAEKAILNANYVRAKLKGKFNAFFDRPCMHECVLSIDPHAMNGVHTSDVAKRLLDYGFYAPTIYFPLIVPEAMMVEPTETESKEMLDAIVAALEKIYDEIQTTPEVVKAAPHGQPVERIDEVSAARQPNLRW